MNLFQIQNATKQFGAKVLFSDAFLSVNDGEHVGVIGPNGAGKTTLFKILTEQEPLDSGEVIKAKGLRIGYLEQESEWTLEESSEDYLSKNCVTPLWNLKKLGLDLGLTDEHMKSPLKNLSGGYRMRMKLLFLIGLEPDLLLLDEPTNFLDLETILVLERFLQDFKKSFLLISHDREFLRRTTEYTVEVESGQITKFPGQIDDYFEQKEELQKVLESQIINQENKRKHLQEFVDRFKAKATKAKQAQSRMKQLDKMETIERKILPSKAHITLPEPVKTGKEILLIDHADMGYENKTILSDVFLRIERGDRLGIVGFNGAGKSTFLKSIADRTPLLKGSLKWGHNVQFSYFAQHLTEDLLLEDTVIDSLQRKAHKDAIAQDILNIAGSLLFSGESLHKKIRVLSGGEKTRVALGQILLQKNPLLLMDEPTNHLDFDTVNALGNAISEFNGTVVLVSHDRSFISRVSSKILEVKDGKIQLYPGTYDDYVWSLEKGALSERSDITESSVQRRTSEEQTKKWNYKEETKKLSSEIKELERKIQNHEKQTLSLQNEILLLNEKLMTTSGQEAQKISIQASELQTKLTALEDEILLYMEAVEQKNQQLINIKSNPTE